jgi:hypothetical protein
MTTLEYYRTEDRSLQIPECVGSGRVEAERYPIVLKELLKKEMRLFSHAILYGTF